MAGGNQNTNQTGIDQEGANNNMVDPNIPIAENEGVNSPTSNAGLNDLNTTVPITPEEQSRRITLARQAWENKQTEEAVEILRSTGLNDYDRNAVLADFEIRDGNIGRALERIRSLDEQERQNSFLSKQNQLKINPNVRRVLVDRVNKLANQKDISKSIRLQSEINQLNSRTIIDPIRVAERQFEIDKKNKNAVGSFKTVFNSEDIRIDPKSNSLKPVPANLPWGQMQIRRVRKTSRIVASVANKNKRKNYADNFAIVKLLVALTKMTVEQAYRYVAERVEVVKKTANVITTSNKFLKSKIDVITKYASKGKEFVIEKIKEIPGYEKASEVYSRVTTTGGRILNIVKSLDSVRDAIGHGVGKGAIPGISAFVISGGNPVIGGAVLGITGAVNFSHRMAVLSSVPSYTQVAFTGIGREAMSNPILRSYNEAVLFKKLTTATQAIEQSYISRGLAVPEHFKNYMSAGGPASSYLAKFLSKVPLIENVESSLVRYVNRGNLIGMVGGAILLPLGGPLAAAGGFAMGKLMTIGTDRAISALVSKYPQMGFLQGGGKFGQYLDILKKSPAMSYLGVVTGGQWLNDIINKLKTLPPDEFIKQEVLSAKGAFNLMSATLLVKDVMGVPIATRGLTTVGIPYALNGVGNFLYNMGFTNVGTSFIRAGTFASGATVAGGSAVAGGLIGSVIGTALGLAVGGNPGTALLGAAIGGTIGGVAGALIGGAVSFGTFSVPAAAIGQFVGSVVGGLVGGLVSRGQQVAGNFKGGIMGFLSLMNAIVTISNINFTKWNTETMLAVVFALVTVIQSFTNLAEANTSSNQPKIDTTTADSGVVLSITNTRNDNFTLASTEAEAIRRSAVYETNFAIQQSELAKKANSLSEMLIKNTDGIYSIKRPCKADNCDSYTDIDFINEVLSTKEKYDNCLDVESDIKAKNKYNDLILYNDVRNVKSGDVGFFVDQFQNKYCGIISEISKDFIKILSGGLFEKESYFIINKNSKFSHMIVPGINLIGTGAI